MKKILLLIVLLFALIAVSEAQSFKRLFILKIDENLTSIQAEWVSMDKDTLPDLVITGIASGQLKIITYQNLKTSFIKKNTIQTGMKSGLMQVTDWNRDNKMDLIIAGQTLINTNAMFVFSGNGNHSFIKQPDKLLDYSGRFRIGDLNSDGANDVLTFGDSFLRVYQNKASALTKHFERTDISPADVQIFDMNNDGVNEYAISPTDLPDPISGNLSLADMDADGYFDVIVANDDSIKTWRNTGDTLVVDKKIGRGTLSGLFTGDINSDGKSDIIIDSIGLITQTFGDQDRDGDLDVVHVKDSIGSQWIKVYRNITTDPNNKPSFPSSPFAVSTFDRTFIFWNPTSDDHTSTNSLTYDLWLSNGESNVVAPSFDLASYDRTVVAHGNAGTNTSKIIKGLADDRYFYLVQAVDNAYNGSKPSGGNVLPCFDLVHDDIQVCKGTSVKLAGGTNAAWFSTTTGFIEQADTLKFIAAVTDTLFAFTPQSLDCSKNKVYVVHVNDGSKSETQTMFVCKGKVVQLSIEPGWSNVHWDSSPGFTVTRADTVIVTAGDDGCTYKKKFFIEISEPVVTIAGDGFQVMRGNSVQLDGGGNAQQWQWDPSQGLSSATIPDPFATPQVTTDYVLTGTDSIGCTASASTHVIVEEVAFVPNLFTPNGDGKNDNLLIYGLTSASRFRFRIFGRDGNHVYETDNVADATNVGWNGAVGETRQPNGIYYWKVDGEMPDGSNVTLNGKTTGSILLVR
jgi:gliding motility-associated-like protein